MEVIQTEEYLGYKINIGYDTDAQDPRIDRDNLGTMVCNHGRYNLGDNKLEYYGESFEEDLLHLLYPDQMDEVDDGNKPLEEVEEQLNDEYLYMPLSLYDHSGISMSTGLHQEHTTGSSFDSGMVGYIYISKARAFLEYSIGETLLTEEEVIKKAYDYMEQEVKDYNQYLSGEIYAYQIEGMEEVDCSWGMGYYEIEDAISDAKEFIDNEDTDGEVLQDADRIFKIAMDAFWDTFNNEKESLYFNDDGEQDGDKEDLLISLVGTKLKEY